MKTIFIGDIHGHPEWQRVVEKEKDAGRIIFVGDYCDSFSIQGRDQLHNLNQIINFKKDNTDKEVILLIGNHDYHYFEKIGENGTGGYQMWMKWYFMDVFTRFGDMFQMAYQFDNILCSHAGIGEYWLREQGYMGEGTIADFVNDVWKYQPLEFNFQGWNPYGDDIEQTPIWIRPKSLMKGNKELKKQYIQVVGHTGQNEIDIKGKATGGRYYFIDTMPREYLIYEDGVFSVGKLKVEKVARQ